MRRPFNPFNVTSVRGRLTLWSMGVLAVALIGCALTVHLTVRALLLRSIDQDLAREANAAFATDPSRARAYPQLPGHDSFDDQPQAPIVFNHVLADREPLKQPPPPQAIEGVFFKQRFAVQFSERHQFMAVRLRDPQGKMLPPLSHADILDRATWDRQFTLAGDRERYTTLPWHGQEWRVLTMSHKVEGQTVGVAQAAYSLQEFGALLHGVDQTLFTLIPLALLVTGCGGAFLTDRALRPVRRITRAAMEVEARDLSRRLPITGGDEFAALATTFNGMFDRLQAAFSQLEASVEQQRRFTADASHELRTPLTTVRANADWALRKPRRAAEYREALTSIVQAADRTNQIIESLLYLARSDSDHHLFEQQPLSLQEILQKVMVVMPRDAASASITLDISDPTLGIVGNVEQLERVFINLLQNSLRHTPADGVIRLSAHMDGDRAVVTVVDTGEGIPAEHLPHVCERFYRVDAARSRPEGGTGLGLAICKSSVEAHGGTLQIESAPGEGTRVRIFLPLLRLASAC